MISLSIIAVSKWMFFNNENEKGQLCDCRVGIIYFYYLNYKEESMSAEGTFLMVCAIIAGLLISSLITYWCRTLFKNMLNKGYIARKQQDTYYVTTFFLMYLPILNIIYLFGLLIIYEISNLERL